MRNAILSLLARGPSHGYELKQQLDSAFAGAWPPVNVGQVYSTLQRLDKDGLVRGVEVQQAGRPPRTDYELTGQGIEEVRLWFATPADAPRLRDDFLMKVVLAGKTGAEDPAQLVTRQRERYLQSLAEIERLASSIRPPAGSADGVAAMALEGAALHLQADLKWLDAIEAWTLTRNG